jgi:hypothetical protein
MSLFVWNLSSLTCLAWIIFTCSGLFGKVTIVPVQDLYIGTSCASIGSFQISQNMQVSFPKPSCMTWGTNNAYSTCGLMGGTFLHYSAVGCTDAGVSCTASVSYIWVLCCKALSQFNAAIPSCPIPSNNQTIIPLPCVPQVKMEKKGCTSLIERCGAKSKMKWTGPGCSIKGVRQFDGGCQCNEYCGYTCKKMCNMDASCSWVGPASGGTCHNKKTSMSGVLINKC